MASKITVDDVDDSVLGEDDLADVVTELNSVAADWESIGTMLRIKIGTLRNIKEQYQSPRSRLNAMLTEWLLLNYDHDRHGKPSWRKIAKAVKDINGAVFEEIVKNHGKVAQKVTGSSAPQTSQSQLSVGDCEALRRKISMKKLQMLRYKSASGAEEELRILNEAVGQWRDIGGRVGISDAILGVLPQQTMGNPRECLREVFNKWIQTTSKDYPTTWQGLINLLRDVDCVNVADRIQEIAAHDPDVL